MPTRDPLFLRPDNGWQCLICDVYWYGTETRCWVCRGYGRVNRAPWWLNRADWSVKRAEEAVETDPDL